MKTILLIFSTVLILLSGIAQKILNNVQQLSPNKYKMDIEIVLGLTTVMQPWVIPILVDKINDNSKIEVDVMMRN